MRDDTASIRAALLIKREPVWWDKFFVQPALNAAARQRRISIQKLMENARDKDFAGIDGESVKLNNNFGAYFARRLIKDHPSIAPFIETRRSKYDD